MDCVLFEHTHSQTMKIIIKIISWVMTFEGSWKCVKLIQTQNIVCIIKLLWLHLLFVCIYPRIVFLCTNVEGVLYMCISIFRFNWLCTMQGQRGVQESKFDCFMVLYSPYYQELTHICNTTCAENDLVI